MRKNQTKEERLLWNAFLRKYPLQWRRQYTIGNYIVDFYCHSAKLVVELDGSQHCESVQMEEDHIRTAYLQARGICVLRLSNLDVLGKFERVCAEIDRIAKARAGGCP